MPVTWASRNSYIGLASNMPSYFTAKHSTTTKSSPLSDIPSQSPIKVNECFGGTHGLELQGQKSKPSKNRFNPEDGDDIFFQSVGWHLLDYVVLCSRQQNSSWPLPWEPQIQQPSILNLIGIHLAVLEMELTSIFCVPFITLCKECT